MPTRPKARAKNAEGQLSGSRQVAEAAKLRADKLQEENAALKKQPIAAVVDEEEVERRANQRAHDIAEDLAAERTADLQARLEQASSGSEQDARDAYDSIILAGRSITSIVQSAKMQFRKLPDDQRETAINQFVHTLASIRSRGGIRMSVKIMALEAENIKRIKAVALTPSPTGPDHRGRQQQSGQDQRAGCAGVGPSAATVSARTPPSGTGPWLPPTSRSGSPMAWWWSARARTAPLTVTDPTGRRSGQQLLNAFIEPLALDLPRFMEASDKEKADILLRIIGIGTELHTRDLEIKALYDKRTFTGQLAAQKKHFAEELISYPDAPEEPVSASDLIRQQQEILARNGENQRLRAQYTELERQEQQCVAELKRTRERIAELEQQYQELDAKHTRLFNQRKTAQKTVAQLQDESTAELEASIRDIEETNRKVRANLEKSRAEDEAARYASDYDKLTEAITRKRADRMALLNGADLPCRS